MIATSNTDIFNDPFQQKRLRGGSISGRLRAASNLEESGFIDKNQKGIIKDMIICGDPIIQEALEKYENGDPQELQNLIERGQFSRHDSIDILCDLDYDFLSFNVNKSAIPPITTTTTSLSNTYIHSNGNNNNRKNSLIDDEYNIDMFKSRNNSIGDFIVTNNIFSDDYSGQARRNRNSSIDSTSSLKLFDFLSNNNESYIDMSAYEAVARSLQTNRSNLTTTSTKPVSKPTSKDIKQSKLSFSSLSSSNNSFTKKDSFNGSITNVISTTNVPNNFSAISGNIGIPNASKHSENPDNKGVIGAYTIEQRKKRIEKFIEKRNQRVWTKKVKYDVRKNFADSRLRVKGRFVKKEEENVMRELLDM